MIVYPSALFCLKCIYPSPLCILFYFPFSFSPYVFYVSLHGSSLFVVVVAETAEYEKHNLFIVSIYNCFVEDSVEVMEDLKKVADDVERVVGSAQAVIKERPQLYGDFFLKRT